MKTAELTIPALAFWVHKANGTLDRDIPNAAFADWMAFVNDTGACPLPLNWALAGPIIEREGISVVFDTWDGAASQWSAGLGFKSQDRDVHYWEHEQVGPTPLIAAMRAYVASVFGEEVLEELKP